MVGRSAIAFLCLLCLRAAACAAPSVPASEPYRPAWAPLLMLRKSGAMVPFLHEMMKSPDAASRARSAFLLGQIGWPGSAKLLAQGLRDSDRSARAQCGIALACMGDARGVPTCAAALTADPAWMRYYAVYGLWCVNGPRAKRILKENAGGQGVLVTNAIRGALASKHVSPPAAPEPKGTKLSADDVLQAVSDAYTGESDLWWHQGDYEQCIRCLEALVFIDPGDVQSYGLIAWLQRSAGRTDEAVRTLNRMVAANPNDPATHSELGRYYMNIDDFARAEEPLRKAVELGGDQLDRRQYAHCLEKLGKLAEASEQWTILLQALPNDPAVVYNSDRVKKALDAGGK